MDTTPPKNLRTERTLWVDLKIHRVYSGRSKYVPGLYVTWDLLVASYKFGGTNPLDTSVERGFMFGELNDTNRLVFGTETAINFGT